MALSAEKRWLEDASQFNPDASPDEIAKYLKRVAPKSADEIVSRVNARLSGDRKVWFCGDRECDGKPHGKFPYPHARGDQYPPPGMDWLTWLLRGGRGSGKTRTGSEYTRYISKKIPYLLLIGPTFQAIRDVMIEGPSGLIHACIEAGEAYKYEPAKKRFTFASGAVATLMSAEEPQRIRGGNFGFLWGDEPAHWDDPDEAWRQALLTLRIGRRPHALATTTPLPNDFMRTLIAKENTRAIGVSTYANIHNLAPNVAKEILSQFEGTFFEKQEIYGEMIDDREGALWSSLQFAEDGFYFDWAEVAGSMDRIVVGVDPAGSQNKRSDLTGVVVGGKRGDVLYAIDDLSGKYSPAGWAQTAIRAYEQYKADAIVVERNYGGDMVRATLKAERFGGRIIEAKATDGKRVRAEPISAKYEQKLARHRRRTPTAGVAKLEAEMVSWIPGEGHSPNRVDAWVWAASSLTRGGGVADLGNPGKQSLGQQQYVGPGSLARRRQIQRSNPWGN